MIYIGYFPAIYIMLQIAIAAFASLVSVLIMYQHLKWTNGKHISHWMLSATRLTWKKENPSAKEAKITAVSTHSHSVGRRDQWCARSGFNPNRTGGSVRAVPEFFGGSVPVPKNQHHWLR
jgi:hypothetical protein